MAKNTRRGFMVAIILVGYIVAVLWSCTDINSNNSPNQDSLYTYDDNVNLDLVIPQELSQIAADVPSLQARAIIDSNDTYNLTVDSNANQVSGTIQGLSIGSHDLDIEYFVIISATEVVLSVYSTQFTIFDGQATTVNVAYNDLDSSYDDDNDGYTNLMEARAGSNPLSIGDVPHWIGLLGSVDDDYGYSISVSADTNIFVTGATYGDLDGYSMAGQRDIYVSKYISNGNKLWTRLVGTSGIDVGLYIATDLNDNAFVTGYTTGNLDGETNAGSNEAFIVKYDTNGNRLWTKLLGTSDSERGRGIAADAIGNIYVAGTSAGDLDGETNAGAEDAFIAKYDTNGNKIWVKLLGTTSADYGRGVSLDNSGNLFVVGYTSGDLGGNINAGFEDIFIAKFDSNGNNLWVRLLGSAGKDVGLGIWVDINGDVYICGETFGNLDGNLNAGLEDGFIAKYDTNGNKLWVNVLGSVNTDTAFGISVDSKGNAYITGHTSGNLDGEPNAGSEDVLIARYNSLGDLTWRKLLGTTAAERGRGIGFDSDDNAYLTGFTEGNLDGNTNMGDNDIMIWKIEGF